MSERDPRRRRKKRESLRKEEKFEDTASHIPEKVIDWRHDSRESDPDQDELTAKIRHEPSQMAKIVFFVLFSLLAVTVGIVFISLHGAERGPIDIFEDAHEPAEVIHGEVDEHGKEIQHDDLHEGDVSEHTDHGDEHDDEQDDEHESEHDDEEEDHDDGSEKGFLSELMDMFMPSSSEPAVEEEDKSEAEEEHTSPPAEVEEKPIVPEEAQTSESEEFAIPSQADEQDDGGDDDSAEPQDDNDEEMGKPQLSHTQESVTTIPAGNSANEKEDDVKNVAENDDNDEEEDVSPPDDDDDDLVETESWIMEHIPLTSSAPPIEDEDSESSYYEPDPFSHSDIIIDDIDESDTIQDSLLDEEDSEPTESYYEKDDITNQYDYLIKEDLDEAEKILEKEAEEDDYFFWRI